MCVVPIGRSGTHRPPHMDRIIRIVFYASSDVLSPRIEIFLCGKSHDGTNGILEKLKCVSQMEEGELYDYDDEKSPIGTGKLEEWLLQPQQQQ